MSIFIEPTASEGVFYIHRFSQVKLCRYILTLREKFLPTCNNNPKSSAVVQQIIKSSWRRQWDRKSSAWPGAVVTPVYGSENETVWSNANNMGFMADLGKQTNRFVQR
jgi:hypothetical protein